MIFAIYDFFFSIAFCVVTLSSEMLRWRGWRDSNTL